MARNMILSTGKCACCGKQVQFDSVDYNEVEVGKELSLRDYFDFKFVNVNLCENCGYVASDLTKLIGPHTKETVATEKYQIAVDDGYIDGFEEVDFQEYENYAIGLFDALAMLYKAENKMGIHYAKIQHRIAELKSVLRGQYYENMCDVYDDLEERAVYDKLLDHLTKQIETADNEALKALKNVKLEYPFEVIMVAECLTRVNKYEQARELIAGVEANFTFNEDLKDYIEEFLTEVERI